MTIVEQEKKKTSVNLPLFAVDVIALVIIAICLAELFPSNGEPLGLIPINFVWPVLIVAVAVSAACMFLLVRSIMHIKNNKPPH